MAFFLFPLFIFSTISFSAISSSIPLLSLWCNPSPSNQTNANSKVNPIETLLGNLTAEAPNSLLTTLNATFRQQHYSGLMQCRPGLCPLSCSHCANVARHTISNLCHESDAVSSWFDGCYVQISSMSSNHVAYKNISNYSCSGRDSNQDPAQYVPALGALFLELRADVNIFTHHGFSHREIAFKNLDSGESILHGLVECVRSLPPQACDSCIGKATEMLLFHCSGKSGGTQVYGPCLARFDSNGFYHGRVLNSSAGGDNYLIVGKGHNSGMRKKLVMEYWSAGVACFLVFVLFVWLLRRRVFNRAKVGESGCADFDEAAGKTDD